MAEESRSARKSRDRRGTARLSIAFLLAVSLLSSCASFPGREVEGASQSGGQKEAAPPPESRFIRTSITIPGETGAFPVWKTRSAGRPILLLHALNGLSPDLLQFALELESWGYRVYLPSLYGDPIRGRSAYGFDKQFAMIRHLKNDGRWNPVATDTLGMIVDDVAMLARAISRAEGGRRLAVIGNSLTGAMPLALLKEPSVGLAVLGQPATPALRIHQIIARRPLPDEARSSLSLSEEDWNDMFLAMRRSSRKRIAGFHYVEDPLAYVERFDVLHDRLAGRGLSHRFTAYVLGVEGEAWADERSWAIGGDTEEKAGMLTPHSTYIAAENPEDLEWFRKRLRETLRRGW